MVFDEIGLPVVQPTIIKEDNKASASFLRFTQATSTEPNILMRDIILFASVYTVILCLSTTCQRVIMLRTSLQRRFHQNHYINFAQCWLFQEQLSVLSIKLSGGSTELLFSMLCTVHVCNVYPLHI